MCEKLDRELWHQEESLINHRQSWSIAGQSMLFAAIGLSGNASFNQIEQFREAVVSLGVAVSVITLIGVLAAIFVQLKLNCRNKWNLWVSPIATIVGWGIAVALPVVFLFAWLQVQSLIN